MSKKKKIALVGNPNSGKTSLFNQLTGLNQKVGNYPGVTVDKRSGTIKLPNNEVCELIDLPGTYSLSSKNDDEKVVQNILLNPNSEVFPDLIIIVLDGTNLARNLFLASQVIELGISTIMAVNMVDIVEKSGDQIKLQEISDYFNVPTTAISARRNKGIKELLELATAEIPPSTKSLFKKEKYENLLADAKHLFKSTTPYMLFKQINNAKSLLDEKGTGELKEIAKKNDFEPLKEEILEISDRVSTINKSSSSFYLKKEKVKQRTITDKIDKYVTHPLWGLLIFLAVFFVLFQAIFTFASYPMDLINDGIVDLGIWVGNFLPDSWFADFISDGIFAGLAGVLVFVPQIMILFALIAILEDTGYLSRVSFMTDGLLKRFGMNGKSVVPLVGGFACSIPAIMAARAIENRRERFITIFIVPLMACSARLPVYVFLVSFIAPEEYIWGFISVQGLYMMGLYLLGFVVALIVAMVINLFIKKDENGSFILELPNYKMPSLRNAVNAAINKGKIFVVQAGKVILIASIILWVLSYFGPGDRFEQIEEKYTTLITENDVYADSLYTKMSSEKLENSYLGIMGKTIEPAIQPLGFDWKIGIALVASFAAREVFVGTMSTIYSVEGGEENEKGLKAIKFSYATAFSLLIFYVFALQCMSTIAVVKQETGSWGIVTLQFVLFTGIAYLASWLTYVLLQ
ncbi:ferrous iron transport protein B [Brumimicrobium mesophilum]|uniref:ferrous iron transport protein B n=1 Tax=Brumimicrobium mesophilum TaxID=392717 RepID=UPI000D142D6C|nr:ferrous iron transport protein B [Brumimicrobium mesophilum]